MTNSMTVMVGKNSVERCGGGGGGTSKIRGKRPSKIATAAMPTGLTTTTTTSPRHADKQYHHHQYHHHQQQQLQQHHYQHQQRQSPGAAVAAVPEGQQGRGSPRSPGQQLFAGAKWTEPPAAATLPKPPVHWMQQQGSRHSADGSPWAPLPAPGACAGGRVRTARKTLLQGQA